MPSALKHNVADIYWEGPGGDLAVVELSAEDQLSELSVTRARVMADEAIGDFSAFLGKDAKVVVMVGEDLTEKRYFSGIIVEMAQAGTSHGAHEGATDKGFLYDIEIAPKMWLLSKNFRSKVYQKQTVREIVTQVMNEKAVRHQWRIKASLKPNEYCVQFKETDFNFVNRLLEHEGIYYYYDHEQESIVFCDAASAHQNCKPFDKAYYAEGDMHNLANKSMGYIRKLYYGEAVGTGKFEAHDYNYEKSQHRLSGTFSSTAKSADAALEHYDHNVGHAKHELDLSKSQAKLMGEAEAAGLRTLEGEANSRHLMCGFSFTLQEHYVAALNQAYLLTSTRVHMEQGSFITQFKAVPMDAPFRPARNTPKPRVDGVQTATVTGPSGSKVFLDKMGRAKLQFHWDREGSMDDSASMWVRVSNNYAGKDYGIQWIPRVGHEVLVQFLDGDPDRPVMVGRVYNDAMTAPLGPDEKWQNMIKTIKDHHILFDDKDGEERVQFRSEKDMKTIVVNDKEVLVGNDHTVQVDNDESITIKRDQAFKAERDQTIEVGRHQTIKVDKDSKETVKGQRKVDITKNYEVTSKTGEIEMTANSGGLTLKSGASTVEIKPTGITLKFGGSKVVLDPSGVTIKGMLVRIN